MRRRGGHAGHLHRQHPAGREHGEQRRKEPVVIAQPVERRVGIEEIDRPGRLPSPEVGALPVDPRRLGGLREHGFGGIHSRDVSVWPPRAEVARDIARSRAQVVDLGRIREVDPIEEVDSRSQALVDELEVLRRVPGHVSRLPLLEPDVQLQPGPIIHVCRTFMPRRRASLRSRS